jgi:hypothetical protein
VLHGNFRLTGVELVDKLGECLIRRSHQTLRVLTSSVAALQVSHGGSQITMPKPILQSSNRNSVLMVESGESFSELVQFPLACNLGFLHRVLQHAEKVALRFALLVREDQRGRIGLALACCQFLHHNRRHPQVILRPDSVSCGSCGCRRLIRRDSRLA